MAKRRIAISGVSPLGWTVGFFMASIGCSSGNVAPRATATIGPRGGSLVSQGVTVEIPGGALPEAREFLLRVTQGPVIEVTPDTLLGLPARIILSADVWPPGDDGYVLREVGEEAYWAADLERSAGATTFAVSSFSTHRVVRSSRTFGRADASACRVTWGRGDAFPTRIESDSTGARNLGSLAAIRANGDCLVDARGQPSLARIPADPVSRCRGQCCVRARCAGSSDAAGCQCTNPDCCFLTRDDREAFQMSPEAASALGRVRDRVRAGALGPNLDVYLNGAFDSSGRVHASDSYHSFGAALDLVLCDSSRSGCPKVTDPQVLGKLPPLLVGAGFSWVLYENDRHVHASIASPTCGVTASVAPRVPAGCELEARADGGVVDGGGAPTVDGGASDGGAPPSDLEVGTSSLSFSTPQGVNPPSQWFTVTNRGGASSLTISDESFWLTESPLAAEIGAGQTIEIQVQVNVGGLAPGGYNDTISILADDFANPPIEVGVSLEVRGTDGGTRFDGGTDGGVVQSDGGASDGGTGMCCCRFLAEHYCANCVGCPQGLCIGGQCYSPCWECVSASSAMSGWACGTSCNAPPADRCDVACP